MDIEVSDADMRETARRVVAKKLKTAEELKVVTMGAAVRMVKFTCFSRRRDVDLFFSLWKVSTLALRLENK